MNAAAAAVLVVALAAAIRAVAHSTDGAGPAPSQFDQALEPPELPTGRIERLARLERLVAVSRAGELDSGLREELEAVAAEPAARPARPAPELGPGSLEAFVRWLEER